ncbi:MbtH family protein [Streptomyces sp. NPDC090052]|uniref:MbtH family protein n=1 Tax=unclassified Streptomyces TaxID=2593676 RepID=UPI00225BCDDF|nr:MULTISPECIES: MbtH family NRPS accessory protein [unclassified Streptomyces]MCX4728489.1 MbtH family NRPS accessory protein [Streptomyces sp. NBC_01306]WSV02306.1 MbtH family NRPS accessory protein [Streptomyces sp. NBC_01020]WSX40372.1 MbtH family NRPS accessory protein [Streptomyces sp. NBC_00963]WSX71657.1 MbtH family NRPS accessory protein [Streptomyces sp. NBC_00932]
MSTPRFEAIVFHHESSIDFRVVVNGEEQYSIWPADIELPAGWRPEGVRGTREECLAHVERVWTDMRPLSLRG